MARRPTSAWRGLATRFLALLIGASVAAGGIVAMVASAPVGPSAIRLDPAALTWHRTPSSSVALSFPDSGSAAWFITGADTGGSIRDLLPVPIASVTKMMSALVILDALPLKPGDTGPCTTAQYVDVAAYQHFAATGQSRAAVAMGEQICENQLLAGLLVRSAGNYLTLLERLMGVDQAQFVLAMNRRAERMGLRATHYVDPTGYDPRSVSTATEQIEVARTLMANPVAAEIVNHSSVTLPVAGTVPSWTPLAGTGDVVGVKSGRTDAAGGCDVLALRYQNRHGGGLVFAAVFGQRGGDLVTPAGDAANRLARSVLDAHVTWQFRRGTSVASVTWGTTHAHVVTESGLTLRRLLWQVPPTIRVDRLSVTHAVATGQRVGWLVAGSHRVALVVTGAVAPPTLWQRLR